MAQRLVARANCSSSTSQFLKRFLHFGKFIGSKVRGSGVASRQDNFYPWISVKIGTFSAAFRPLVSRPAPANLSPRASANYDCDDVPSFRPPASACRFWRSADLIQPINLRAFFCCGSLPSADSFAPAAVAFGRGRRLGAFVSLLPSFNSTSTTASRYEQSRSSRATPTRG